MDKADKRHGKMVFRRVIKPNSNDPLLRRELSYPPRIVVQRWIEGEYLQRSLPSVGYRYAGLFLSLCGYYEYTAYTASDTNGNRGHKKTKGFARFFLHNGEIALAAIRSERNRLAGNLTMSEIG